MGFNEYQLYSAVSVTEKNNEKDMLKIVEIADKLNSFNKSCDIKDYLKENWNLKDDIKNFALVKNAEISTRSKDDSFIVTFKQKNKISTYKYCN